MDDPYRRGKRPICTSVASVSHTPCRLSVMLKYVNPNSLTFSSSAKHWARESGSEMKDERVVKSLREIVLGTIQDLLHPVGRGKHVRDVMVNGGEGAIWAADRSAGGPPTVEF